MVRPRVFLDIVTGTQPAGRIVIELFNDKTPETCENFRLLCTGAKGRIRAPNGVHDLCYKNTTFHRIISEFMIQGGDITKGDGTGGASTLPNGKMFPDENLGWRNLDAEGLVCMANRGKGTNSSQFFITLSDCDYLTPKHTCFGHVVSGMDVVKKLENLPVDDSDHPIDVVIIANCGELLFRKKESSTPKNTHIEVRRERSRSRDRNKDGDSRRHHRRKRSRSPNTKRSRSRSKEANKGSAKDAPDSATKGAAEKNPDVPASEVARGRSKDRVDAPPGIPASSSPPLPKQTSRSRSRHRRRRRRYHSGSRSPERRRHRHGRSRSRSRRGYWEKVHDYTRDEGAEERIRREEEERENERFARMEEDSMRVEPEVKFKGRGSMKYREKKSWGWGGGEGRLV